MSEILIYQSSNGKVKLDVMLENETIWLSQKQLCELYGKSKSTISEHIKAIFEDEELDRNSVVRFFRTTASDGKNYDVEHYNLDVIIALGFKVRSRSGVQFRKWANSTLKEYIIKGFVIDDDRLKNPVIGDVKAPDYFDELLHRIKDIRASEKRVYLRTREIFKLAGDYDPSWSETTKFFSRIQNKLHYAITHQTAAEIIHSRAVAKNYLNEQEIDELNRIVIMWLDYAEDQANRRKQIFLKDWEEKLDGFLKFNEREVLGNFGSITKKEADKVAKEEYKKFSAQRRAELEAIGEEQTIKALENIAKKLTRKSDV